MSLRQEIKAYLDGELDGAKALQVAQLLQEDADLRKEADAYRSLSATLRLVKEPDAAPVGLQATLRVLEGGGARKAARFHWKPSWQLALAGIGTAALLMIVFPVFSSAKYSAKSSDAMLAKASEPAASMSFPGESAAESAAPSTSKSDYRGKASASDEMRRPNTTMKSPVAAGDIAGGRAFAPVPPPMANKPPIAPETQRGASSASPPLAKSMPMNANPMAPGRNRLVIQDAKVGLFVGDVPTAQEKVALIAKEQGGYVASSNLWLSGPAPSQNAAVQIRVPVEHFQDALNAIRLVGEVYVQDVSGNDVTVRVADAQGRLISLKAEANQLRVLLAKAKSVEDVLQVRDRLSQVDQEIQAMENIRSTMKDQSAMSTITVNLEVKQKPVPLSVTTAPHQGWFEDTMQKAGETFSGIVKMIVGVLAQFLALAPVWLPIVGLGYLAWRIGEKRRGY